MKRVKNKDIKKLCRKELNFPVSEAAVNEAINVSKAAYIRGESRDWLSGAEFIFFQGKYIKKTWWLLQAVLLMGLWCVISTSGSSFIISRTLGAAAPLFCLLILPELLKNRSSGAMEIEGTSFYSLRQIYSARMILFAMVDALFLSLFSVSAILSKSLDLKLLTSQFFLPLSVCACICFSCLYMVKRCSELWSVTLCFIWTFLWEEIVIHDRLYYAVSPAVWNALLTLSLAYLVFCIIHGQRKCENDMEVKLSWN